MAYMSGLPEAIRMAENLLERQLEYAAEDGYIGIYDRNLRYQHEEENGEFWGQSRILLSLLAAYEYTDREDYLQAVIRAADITVAAYRDQQPYFSIPKALGGIGHGLMITDAMFWLYEISGKDSYHEFAIKFATRARVNKLHDDRYSLQYGPLLYALPFEEEFTPTKDYPVAGFHDYDITAANDPGEWKLPADMSLATSRPERKAREGKSDIWEYPPCNLTCNIISPAGKEVASELVPIGSTISRYSAFIKDTE